MSELLPFIPNENRDKQEEATVVYSREGYEKILELIADCEEQIATFRADLGKYTEDLDEHKRIYEITSSDSRKTRLDASRRKVRKAGIKLGNRERTLEELKAKLKTLYELAYGEALKEDDLYEEKRLQTTYERVTTLEGGLLEYTPEYDAAVSELVSGIATWLAKNPPKK